MVWLVFDSREPIDLEPIRNKGGSIISRCRAVAAGERAGDPAPAQPAANALAGRRGSGGRRKWTLTFADTMRTPIQPLAAIRNITDPALANVTVPMSKPGLLHRLVDPDAGDTLMVVTAPPPVRGFIKRQDFVEFSLLELIHGVAIRPNSDDVTAEIALRQDHARPSRRPDAVVGRMSARSAPQPRSGPIFDIAEWRKNQPEDFFRAAGRADCAPGRPKPSSARRRGSILRVSTCRAGMYPEAKGVLDLSLGRSQTGSREIRSR